MEIWGYLLRQRREFVHFLLALVTTLGDAALRPLIYGVRRRQMAAVLLGMLFPVGLLPVPSNSLSIAVNPLLSSLRQPGLLATLVLLPFLLSGCGLGSGPEVSTPEPQAENRVLVPTFTPTPQLPPTPEPAVAPPTDTPVPPTPEPVEVVVPEDPTATPTEAPAEVPASTNPQLVVSAPAANVRRGPGTQFGIVGAVNQGMSFEVSGRNAAGDWYQFCCVNGETGWIFGALVDVESPERVALAQNIPVPPPTNTPAPAPPPPPTNTPPPAAPPPSADPCAGIGGDGCKFRVSGGPASINNGGLELKLQLFFKHSGVDGGQPQGSYFIALEKDGQRLPIPDSIRSIALQRNDGPQGPYNYEYKVGSSQLPGGNVAGSYTGWVLDGNGERDSQNFSFSLGDGQGEVWIEFDQG